MFARTVFRGIRASSLAPKYYAPVRFMSTQQQAAKKPSPSTPSPSSSSSSKSKTSSIDWDSISKNGVTGELPLKLYSVSGQYASALWSMADATGTLEQVQQDMKTFTDVYHDNAQLREFLNDPTIAPDVKSKKLEPVLDAMKVGEVTKRTFLTMAHRKRLTSTGALLKDFSNMLKAHQKIVDVEVVSAKKLSEDELKKLESTLRSNKTFGEVTPILTNRVEPSIIGGIQLSSAEQFIDLSHKSQLDKLHSSLSKAVNNYFDQRKTA
eukprot:TRINITY_DN974_c0_g1_i1.p1 TRINITY_DN974_c0_g1~~TRINITY_DN974_c0_g1_i1.p1  ORF type:complete len:280 (-),score=93.65 TRINITY_DN974_c0_g1_i1:102-899(-)